MSFLTKRLSTTPKAAPPAPEQISSANDIIDACNRFPFAVATLIARYAMHRFDDVIFGPEQWKTCWGATPVTLASIDALRKRVADSGRRPPKPLHEMSVEDCANFLGDRGKEELPQAPEDLYFCLNNPVRQGERLAALTCVVTYIPEYVRLKDKVVAVTCQSIALILGPKPKKGQAAKLVDSDKVLNQILSSKDAQETERSCYFVMELDVAPSTKGKKPADLMPQISKQGDGGWQLPEARPFLASVFARRVWKGTFLYGLAPSITFTYGQGKSRNGCLAFGGFGDVGLCMCDSYSPGNPYYGAAGGRKFQVLFTK